jgi:hypothetical protein
MKKSALPKQDRIPDMEGSLLQLYGVVKFHLHRFGRVIQLFLLAYSGLAEKGSE